MCHLYQLLTKFCQQCLKNAFIFSIVLFFCKDVLIFQLLISHHPLPVDEPVGGDVCVALNTPGQVKLITVQAVSRAGKQRLIWPTWK